MKKAFALILLLVCSALLFTACAAAESAADEATEVMLISSEDGYESAGYVCFETENTGTYTFTSQGSSDIEWSVYLFDEEFGDALRYISQAAKPLLTEDGSLSLEAGQFVYVYCSANGFTDIQPDSSAKLLVTFEE